MDDLTHIRERRAARLLATSIRHAALHATPRELLDLDRLIILVRNHHLTKAEAIERVEALRRTQDQRRHAA
jgi:hypothetical protein